eukprot:TRINITY_DN93355_c0_g1_i1.p1 TRINITY_DN93355_c0_g1~~TRINITY_DN93355_c0_g1_i1.p1  ORF type:complete len:559 (-),score=118.24 TRINITY_DN93355_c0_g1_i1:431-2107(-)
MMTDLCKMESTAGAVQNILFVFPMASGHVNPSLPIARLLCKQGHRVHYVCYEQMREAIEDTGAIFYSDLEILTELYENGGSDPVSALTAFVKEHGLGHLSIMEGVMELKPALMERKIPGIFRFMQDLRPNSVVYCPLVSDHAAFAAKALGIPSVALFTTAGPGSIPKAFDHTCQQLGTTIQDMDSRIRKNEQSRSAAERLKVKYGFPVCEANLGEPIGKVSCCSVSAATLVTTSEGLYDPVSPALQDAYKADGAKFIAVGPLLDESGSKRAAGHKAGAASNKTAELGSATTCSTNDLLARVRVAKTAKRPVILASLGSVITGDFPNMGWHSRPTGTGGQQVGITGCQLCQAAWGAVFDVFGMYGEAEEDAPLIIVSLGPQDEPLGGLIAPKNAICEPTIPQVELLQAGVDLFLTHGGQNSFTEALANGVPVVVCPGFGDQLTNAQKAVDIGVGLKIDRPTTPVSQEAEAAEAYRQNICEALKQVWKNQSFKLNCTTLSEELRRLGGVRQAVETILSVGAAAIGGAGGGRDSSEASVKAKTSKLQPAAITAKGSAHAGA